MEIIIDEELELKRAGFYWRESLLDNKVRVLCCAPLEQDKLTNGFSTRTGGVSSLPHESLNLAGFSEDTPENIFENRRRFLNVFAGEWTLATCWQVHGADVRVVRDTYDARSITDERCDALITRATNILLGVQTADCVPVLLGDARTGAVAAIHAGWRGTAASIATKTLQRMAADFGTRATDVRVAIGPSARACCYEVGSEVIELFRARFPDADGLLAPMRDGRARIDLQRANSNQLIAAGVDASRIHIAPLCTMCRTDILFSYRREKALRGRVGRLLAAIGLSSVAD
jgi:YfiH family protein